MRACWFLAQYRKTVLSRHSLLISTQSLLNSLIDQLPVSLVGLRCVAQYKSMQIEDRPILYRTGSRFITPSVTILCDCVHTNVAVGRRTSPSAHRLTPAGVVCERCAPVSESACHASRSAEASLRGCKSIDTSRHSIRIRAPTPWLSDRFDSWCWCPVLWELG